MKKIFSLLSSSSKSAMANSMEGKKEVYYTLVEQFESGLNDKKGCCFLMNFQPDVTKFRARQLGQLMWVTSGNIFDTQNQTQKKKFFVKGMKNKSSSYEFVQTQVRTSLTGEVAFINCDYPDEKARKDLHFLTFGYLENRPDEVFAYVYDGKKVKELKFVKTDGAGTYKLDKHAGKTEFNMRKAVGAPVINDKGGIQVVGLLDRNKDGTLYPVFFYLEMFKTGQVGASLPSTDFSQDVEDVGLPSDRDEKDSPLTHGLTGGIPSSRDEKDSPTPPHGLTGGIPSSRDEKDSPTLPHGLTDNMGRMNLAGNNGPLSGIQEENNQAGCAGPFQDQQQAQRHTAAPAFIHRAPPPPRCIKNETISSELHVNINILCNKLKILLDPEDPLGLKDYRGLANSFGYGYNMMTYLSSKKVESPTIAILHDQRLTCTIWELRQKLQSMEREDAVEKVDEYIEMYCKCDDCNNDLC